MKRRQRGFSLIEIVIVMAIFAVLFGMAAPAFNAWRANVQIRTATESIQNGLQLARAEAIRRNTSVMFWLDSGTNPLTGDWLVGCAAPQGNGAVPEAAGDCPGMDTQQPNFAAQNWIQRASSVGQQTTMVQVTTFPPNTTSVTFNSLGMVMDLNPADNNSAPMQTIDITPVGVAGNTLRPLEVQIGGGQIRMCDLGLLLINDPRGCN